MARKRSCGRDAREVDACLPCLRLLGDAVTVIDFEAAKRRRQGFQVLAPDDISLKVYDNHDGRGYFCLSVKGEDEELLLHPNTMRAWAKKLLAVAAQIDAPAPRLALVEDA